MQTLSEIRELLAQRGLRPKHRLGQNFLHDKNQLAKLIEAADIRPGDLVLEVGSGTGTLTEELLKRSAEVIACEVDRDLAGILKERFGHRLTLIVDDCLEGERTLNGQLTQAIGGRRFKLVANLPYQIASALISALLLDHPNCTGQYVTIQKEAADRLAAKPSTKAYGALSIIVQAFADVRRISTLSRGCFWPPPDVTSAMVAITPKSAAEIGDGKYFARREFAAFVVKLFTKRRKQLGTTFGRGKSNWPAGVTSDLRPEALTVPQIVELWHACH